ncbi:MAG: DUF5615 family PIN-like protein [Acidimicrobiia bacterium]
MRLLFDQNLSRRLVGLLADLFPGSSHVMHAGLDMATDREVWEFAKSEGYAVVSKDADFNQLAVLFGAPPKVVWLRSGNQGTAQIAELLRSNSPVIDAFDRSQTDAVLVLPGLPAEAP